MSGGAASKLRARRDIDTGGRSCNEEEARSRHGQEPPPPIAAEPLTSRAVFPDDVDLKLKLKLDGKDTAVVNVDEPSRTVVVRYTVQPGAQFPW
ncbi:MAG TPA: hypothetical protein VK874_09810, partial [Gaiellaceae bacterium]|nr:hypothetical protein [Gaiellaceae bacterium]